MTQVELVNEMFAGHARRRPDAIAVVDNRGSYTYADVDAAADAVGCWVEGATEGLESAVAVTLPRGFELVVATLACWRAGRAVLLIDPSWPPAYQRAIARGVRASAIIGEDGAGPVRNGLDIRSLAELVAHLDVPAFRHRQPHPNSLAYLVHTSGSTGRPKVVGVPHVAVGHRAATYRATYGLTSDHRGSWISPPSASVGVIEVWPYLASGAAVHAADSDVVAVATDLRDWIAEEHVTHTFAVPTIAEQLFRLAWPPQCSLRILTIGGDALRMWPPTTLPFNVVVEYGSAEAYAVSSWIAGRAGAGPEDPRSPDRIPHVGLPWPHARLGVVDKELAPVPPGLTGELVVAGPELARGYVNDARLTAERFIPDPSGYGGRRYRSGDLVEVGPDGFLRHHGRTDRQVKVNGVRVELADIEAVLLEHDDVMEAAIVPTEDESGRVRLVAHVALSAAGRLDRVKEATAVRLPLVLVPSSYKVHNRLPTTTSGKLARDQLRGRSTQETIVHRSDGGMDPHDVMVERLWCEILQVSDARTARHFLDAGGDSMRAGQLTALVWERLGVRVRLRDFLQEPTLDRVQALVRTLKTAAGRKP